MNEASYYIGRGRKVALVLQPYPETIETLEESKDLNRGRAYLREMAEEHGGEIALAAFHRDGVELDAEAGVARRDGSVQGSPEQPSPRHFRVKGGVHSIDGHVDGPQAAGGQLLSRGNQQLRPDRRLRDQLRVGQDAADTFVAFPVGRSQPGG